MPRSLTAFFLTALCIGQVGSIAAESDARTELQVRALRRSLFKTGSPLFSDSSKPRVQKQVFAPRPAPVQPAPAPARGLSLQPTTFTPYDRYMASVRRVIASLNLRQADMFTACSLMRQGRNFRYILSDPYRAEMPSRTAARSAGDCKAKALWLYDRLGDATALYVIGKLERGSRRSHAWVYWRDQGRWWILDPTDRDAPIAADSVAPYRYVPYYSFGKDGAYRHAATRIFVQNKLPEPAPTVAARSQAAPDKTASRRGERLVRR